MDITVVICTHNRAKLLGTMLDVLSRATFPTGSAIDILVVANACQDNTDQVLDRYCQVFGRLAGPEFRWLNEPVAGKSVALNLAVKESRGNTLCFIDDDQFVDADFLPQLVSALSTYPEYEIFCGGMVPDWDGSEPGWVHETGQFHIGIRPFPEYDLGNEVREVKPDMKLPSGGNITVKRSVFERSGGFSTDLGPQGHNLMGGEDIEFVKRAMQTGARILYVPSIRQKHAVEAERMATLYMMRKSYLRSLSNVMLNSDQLIGIRPYMALKLMQYALQVLISLSSNRRFYYLIRLAAAFGEMRGAFRKQNFHKP